LRKKTITHSYNLILNNTAQVSRCWKTWYSWCAPVLARIKRWLSECSTW